MIELERYTVDSSIERKILTGMIVSTQFCDSVIPAFDISYFQSSYSKKVAQWCKEHYRVYRSAAGREIQNIYEYNLPKLDTSEREIIAALLSELSSKFESLLSFNVEYHSDQSLRYFKRRELEIRARNVLALLDRDRVEDAEAEFTGFKAISKVTSNWYNPFSDRYLIESFEREEGLLKLPGSLGEFIGPLDTGWVVAIEGAYKSGKTWLADEFAFVAASAGIPTAIINHEMHRKGQNKRIYRRVTGYKNPGRQNFAVPCFDCKHNQEDNCEKSARVNHEPVPSRNGRMLAFDPSMTYKPCDECRKVKDRDYQLSTWFKLYEPPDYNYENVHKYLTEYKEWYGDDSLRIICYPRFTATESDCERDLDILEYQEGFVPKVIVWDYPNITRSSQKFGSQWQEIDYVWKRIAGIATKRNCLILCPNQITGEGLEEKSIKKEHTKGLKDIQGHVDATFTVNQTPDEKRRGFWRVACLVHRHGEHNEHDEMMVLQSLASGQMCLDAERIVR